MIYGTKPNRWSDDAMKFFLCVLGMVFVVEGLPYVAFPEKVKAYLSKIQEMSALTLRLLGLSAIIAGMTLVYFGTS
jgi:uncharacterized protein YjeT (DUF2065 family)